MENLRRADKWKNCICICIERVGQQQPMQEATKNEEEKNIVYVPGK